MQQLILNNQTIDLAYENQRSLFDIYNEIYTIFDPEEYSIQQFNYGHAPYVILSPGQKTRPLSSVVKSIKAKVVPINASQNGNEEFYQYLECLFLIHRQSPRAAIDALYTFIKLSARAKKSIEVSNIQMHTAFEKLQIQLFSILKGLKLAFATSDSEMLTDLLEHELRDNLTQWKIQLQGHLVNKEAA